MSKQYDQYLTTHRSNVEKGFEWLQENLPGVMEGVKLTKEDVGELHDLSKYGDEEYDAYDKYFYGGNRSYGVVNDFNLAWLHHIHNNPHHWQHWVLICDEPDEGEKVLEMPYQYIVEMICDWWAFSWAKDSLNEIFSWYNEHKDHIKLHPGTRKIVENILMQIESKLYEVKLYDQN